MNLTELLAFLDRIHRRPNKKLSQNFLIDENIALKIVKTADVSPGDTVLEIGPGPGSLTIALLNAGAHVIAVEKDACLSHELARLKTADHRLTSLHADFLEVDLSLLPAPLKVVANLPYHITTPILEKLLEARERLTTLTLMVQDEVATRMAASSGSKDYSSFSLFIQFHTEITASFKVVASCFYPKPKVDSRVIQLTLRPPPLENSEPFFKVMRRSFQQRRKMLRSSLQSLYPAALIEQSLLAIGAKADARPEALTLDEWISFYKTLAENKNTL
jgi:16S rRNA (adenine1518-N6/adenine1519-N6)-dimethyltransferase